MGYQRGRHIISLWRDLGCFNKFNIIYEVLRILGFSPNSTISGKIYKLDRAGRRDHGPYIRGKYIVKLAILTPILRIIFYLNLMVYSSKELLYSHLA